MTEGKIIPLQGNALRRRAENKIREKAAGMENLEALSPEKTRQMLHELQVHQIELEIQNDELRRAQTELEASRSRYLDLYELAPIGYFTVSEEGLILEANLTAALLLDVKRGDLTKRPFSQFILEDNRDSYYLHRKQLFDAEEPQAYELRMVKKDGTTFWAELVMTTVRNAGGVPECRVVMKDISARKQAENVLRVSEERYRDLFEAMDEGFCVVEMLYDPDGEAVDYRFVEINPAFEKQTGLQQALGKTIRQMVPNHDAHWFEIYGKVARTGEAIRFQNPAHAMQRYYDVYAFRINGDGSQKVGILFNDITKRKQAELDLIASERKLRKAISTTVQVLVAAVETRDPYTSGHQIRSADLARAMAIEMGLPQEVIEGIHMAGTIHDIGKISVPAEILVKPTKLSDLEFSLIKEHARKGFEMLKYVESPWPLAEIVYQHHERMDGSGYPRGLKGEETLIEARILAIADVVESMASHRPYRPSLGLDAALAEIENNKGTLYDSNAVDACLRLFREKGYQLEGIRF